MGMSSSQARLLSLTGRMHDIEYKAQRIQAQKLQLANESDRVYDDYLRALDSKKMQYKALNNDGSTTYRDANLRILENGAVKGYTGEVSNKSYLVQNAYNGDIYVTPEFAAQYGITGGKVEDPGDLDTWLTNHGCTTEEVMRTVTDYSNVTGATPVENNLITEYDYETVYDGYSYSLNGTVNPTQETITNYDAEYTLDGNITKGEVQTPYYPGEESYNFNSGSYNAATIITPNAGTENWTLNMTGFNPANVVDPVSEVSHEENYITPANTVNAGEISAPQSVVEVLKSKTTVSNTYHPFKNMTFQYNSTDLNLTMEQLSDKYGWNMNFDDSYNKLSVSVHDIEAENYPGLNGGYNLYSLSYTDKTKLSELLTQISNKNSNITYNSTTGILTSTVPIEFASNDDGYYDDILAAYLIGFNIKNMGPEGYEKIEGITKTLNFDMSNEKIVGLNTKINEVAHSDKRIYTFDDQPDIYFQGDNKLYIKDKETGRTLDTSWGADYEPSRTTDATYGQYFEYLKNKFSEYNFNYAVVNGNIELSIDGNFIFGDLANLIGHTDKITKTTTTTNINLNANAIAENIYLAKCLSAGQTTIENYNANHNEVATYASKIMEISNMPNGKAQVAVLNDRVNEALATYKSNNDKETLYTTITQILSEVNNKSIINTDNKYQNSNSTDAQGNVTINNYNITVSNNSITFTPSTEGPTRIIDIEAQDGKIEAHSTTEDIKRVIAADINGVTGGNTTINLDNTIANFPALTGAEWAILSSLRNSADYAQIKTQLNSGTKPTILSNYNLSDYNYTPYTGSNTVSYSKNDNTGVVAGAITNNPSSNDTLLMLAHSMLGDNKNLDTTVNSLKTQFDAKELAIISSYYGKSEWNDIVNSLRNGNYSTIKANYTNAYNTDEYSFTENNNNTVSNNFGGMVNSHYGEITTVSANDIASQIVKDAYGVNGDFETNKTGILNKFTSEQLANLSIYYGTTDWNTIINNIKNNQSVDTWANKYTSAEYNITMNTTDNMVLNTESAYSTYQAVAPSSDDVLNKLAIDIYNKKGSTDDANEIRNNIATLFNERELASLAYYMNKTSDWDNIVDSLSNGSKPDTTYTTRYNDSKWNVSFNPTNSSINSEEQSHENLITGLINIPTLEGIASNLVVAFRKAGKTVEEADVLNKLNDKFGIDDDTNNLNLANINKVVCDYLNSGSNSSSIDNIYNVLFGSGSLNIPSSYDSTKYDIKKANLGRCAVTYGTKEEGTGVYVWTQNETYREAVESYNAAKILAGKQYVVVTNEQASSADFVNNIVIDYGCNLLAFDTTIDDMRGTSISVETSLREVSDETDLKKAEAQYEADMKRIDRKDAKYDTQLAKLDTERTAIKEEMETLKTVIKENGERTFKLFS